MFFVAQIIGDRERQEDGFAAATIELSCAGEKKLTELFVVADGMGGHAGGEVASRVAVDAFVSSVRSGGQWCQNTLALAIDAANQSIASEVSADPRLRGMGTTFLGVLCSGDRLEWISVGDSLLLLYRDAQLVRLNEDHSMLPLLLETALAEGQSSRVAYNDPRRHRLRSALSGMPLRLVDSSASTLAPDDLLILASDGVETLTMAEVAESIEHAEDDCPQRIARAIIEQVAARKFPRQDNATLIVYRHR